MASAPSSGAGAGAGSDVGRARQRSRSASPRSLAGDAGPGASGAGGTGGGAAALAPHIPFRVSVAWAARSFFVPVLPEQRVADLAEVVRQRRPGALCRPRLFCEGHELWGEDVAHNVLREGDAVAAVWDHALRKVLASSPAVLMVAECLGSAAALCALAATCSDALRAVRGLELDWDVSGFDSEDHWDDSGAWKARQSALFSLRVSVAQVAAWRASFPRTRCCRLVVRSPLTQAARSSLRGLRRLRLTVFDPAHVTIDVFKELGSVVDLHCTAWPSTPALAPALGRLTSLRRLELDYEGICDMPPGVFKALALTQLEVLKVKTAGIRDEDMQWLPVALRRLEIGGSQSATGMDLSDEGCAFLTRLTRLTELNFFVDSVTDVVVSHIAQLTSLTRLELSVPVTDAALGHVGGMVGLRDLGLYDSSDEGMTDAGVAHLGYLTALRRLELFVHDTAVTPAALASLAPCAQLHYLRLYGRRPFGGDRRELRAVDVASLASLKRLMVDSRDALSEEDEAELVARDVEVRRAAYRW